jgi:predicted nucleotidyltransferase component of viral defense system
VAQKIHALAGRTEPQARDIFDLNLLLARPEAGTLILTDAERRWIDKAIEQAMSISFDDYASKVVAYLDPRQAALFEERSSWDAMQDSVISRLQGMR